MFHALLITLALAQGGDATTTVIGLQQGMHEQHPALGQNVWVNTGIHSGAIVSEQLLLRRLHVQHPKLATSLAIASIGLHGWVTVHNVGAIRQQAIWNRAGR